MSTEKNDEKNNRSIPDELRLFLERVLIGIDLKGRRCRLENTQELTKEGLEQLAKKALPYVAEVEARPCLMQKLYNLTWAMDENHL